MTHNLLICYLPLAPLDGISLLLRYYIATTGKTLPLIMINVLGNLVNAITHFVGLYVIKMGIYTAPLSIALAYVAIVAGAAIYIRISSSYKETWHPVTSACLEEWSIYLKLAIPGIGITM